MHFTIAITALVGLVANSVAAPVHAPVSHKDLAIRDTFLVGSDVGFSAVELPDLPVTHKGIEARQAVETAAAILEIIAATTEISKSVDQKVHKIIAEDITRRQEFTKQTMASLRQRYPKLNFIMSNVGYSFTGKTVTKNQVMFHNKLGRAVSFDVISFHHGKFVLQGDGGFQNWAYMVDTACVTNGGAVSC